MPATLASMYARRSTGTYPASGLKGVRRAAVLTRGRGRRAGGQRLRGVRLGPTPRPAPAVTRLRGRERHAGFGAGRRLIAVTQRDDTLLLDAAQARWLAHALLAAIRL